MRLIDRLRGEPRRSAGQRMSIDDYAQMLNSFIYDGLQYGFVGGTPRVQQTLAGPATEMAPDTFVGLATQAYQSNGPVFACMLVRQLVFSSIRFRWQRIRDGKPSDTFGNPDLGILERPWQGGTTQDMLSRMIQDADLAGNSYWFLDTPLPLIGTRNPRREFVRMRPDWVDVVVEERQVRGGRGEVGGGQVGWRKLGYLYTEGGRQSGAEPVAFFADEVVHFGPIPDPLANYRGMSWLTPILREIRADQAMSKHQAKFFDNGATVNLVIKHNPMADPEAIKKWVQEVDSKHAGVDNAWKNLNLYPGADAEVVGSNLREIDFKNVRGGGETRIAAAAGVPPVIVGLSEGLAAATYSNYGQARRRLADGTAHPLWQNLSGCIGNVMPDLGPDVRLWYDTSDVPFLREDEKDAADIQKVKAETINTLITAGYEPDSVVAAVNAGDLRLLKHTGMTSVQLLPPGQSAGGAGNSTEESA
ncbi:portal protein [Mycobacterium phage Babsiella]|uniref:Portal protein n=1 Tax=Mycobacterium phage Babsiella TaxID=2902842 RepID=G8I6N7_9CAUD|nr:portal protein [Mycobacterium phage Babsiella]AER48381.1 portal protein [Mycobacterium phage Babsiella]